MNCCCRPVQRGDFGRSMLADTWGPWSGPRSLTRWSATFCWNRTERDGSAHAGRSTVERRVSRVLRTWILHGSRSMRALFAIFALIFAAGPALAQSSRIADRDIIEAYEYLLGRLLVLRQETLDFKEGLKWNEIVH